MNPLDKHLRAALAADEADLLRQIDEPSLSEQVVETFRGKSRWLMTLAFLVVIGWSAVAIVSAIQFFRAEEFHEMLAWAGGFGLGIIAAGLIKIWCWMELNKYVITREIKRVELQIAQLSDRLPKAP